MKKKHFFIFLVLCFQQLQSVDAIKIDDKDSQKDYRVGCLMFGGSMMTYGALTGLGSPFVIGSIFVMAGSSVIDNKIQEDPWYFKKLIDDAIVDLQKKLPEEKEKSKEEMQREIEMKMRGKTCQDIQEALHKLIINNIDQNISKVLTSIDCIDTPVMNISDESALALILVGKKIHMKYQGQDVGDDLVINRLTPKIISDLVCDVVEKITIEKIKISCHAD